MGLVVLVFAGVLAAQGVAETPVPAPAVDPAAKAEAAKPEKPKLVCVTESVIGTHRKRRICYSQEELDKRQEHDQQMRSMPITKPQPEGRFKPGHDDQRGNN